MKGDQRTSKYKKPKVQNDVVAEEAQSREHNPTETSKLTVRT